MFIEERTKATKRQDGQADAGLLWNNPGSSFDERLTGQETEGERPCYNPMARVIDVGERPSRTFESDLVEQSFLFRCGFISTALLYLERISFPIGPVRRVFSNKHKVRPNVLPTPRALSVLPAPVSIQNLPVYHCYCASRWLASQAFLTHEEGALYAATHQLVLIFLYVRRRFA